MENEKLTLPQKAAAVVVSLGADKASKIYKQLNENDIEKLTIEVARLGHITPEQMEEVLDEFYKTCLTVLEKAFGESTAQTLLERLAKSLKTRPFEFIRKSNVRNLISFLQHERPQTIALILSYADPDQASMVISELPKEKQIKVVESIARMESASPDAIKIVEASLKKKFESVLTTADFTTIGGIDYIADVMNHMDRANEKYIFDELGKENEELADTIRKKMFVFEDIVSMDNRSIQRFIRECDVKDIVYALKGSDDKIKELVFANVSTRMAESIRSDLEITVNVRLRDVEEAQQRIVGVIRRLEEAGELIIVKSGKDEIIA